MQTLEIERSKASRWISAVDDTLRKAQSSNAHPHVRIRCEEDEQAWLTAELTNLQGWSIPEQSLATDTGPLVDRFNIDHHDHASIVSLAIKLPTTLGEHDLDALAQEIETILKDPSKQSMDPSLNGSINALQEAKAAFQVQLGAIEDLTEDLEEANQRNQGLRRRLHERLEQQARVAAFGREALEHDGPLDDLMASACETVASTLGMEYAKVLELLPEENMLLLRVGIGWDNGLVGQAHVPTDEGSQAGFTLQHDDPVLLEDWDNEDRFTAPTLLKDHGIASGISVPIEGPDGPWGVLGVHTRHPRSFTKNDGAFVQSIANVLGAAIERRRNKTTVQERAQELKQANRTLQHTLSLHQSTLDATADGILVTDTRGNVITYNDRFQEIWNLPPDLLTDGNEEELIERLVNHLADPSQLLERISELDEDAESSDRLELNDGRVIEQYSQPQRMEDEIVGRVWSFRDVTAKEQAQKQFTDLLEAAPDAILLVEADGEIEFVNKRTETMFGYERDELLGQPIEVLVPEDVRQEHVENRDAYMADPKTRPMGVGLGLEGVRKDGTRFPVEISLSPLFSERGVQVVTAVRDMTQREQIQEELRVHARRVEEANEELAQANEDLRQFAYAASHDLQEPVRMVASYVQLLNARYEGELDEDADLYLGYAVEGAQRIRELIKGLLKYSRVDTRASDPQPVDLDELVDEVHQSLDIKIQETDATIEKNRLPTVMGDPSQLSQVFQNLLSNAIKFRKEDTPPWVRITAKDHGEVWTISVEDNGIGINPDYADKLFTIFQRGHGRDDYEGQGIGLAICKKIIQRHGGDIWIDSEPQEGTTFHFTLPKTQNEHA